MNINLDRYKIFYIVAVNGSISKAADIMCISQPAVTYQIKQLEQQLNITLFVRTKKGVILTEEGTILFDYVKTAMDSISNGENTLTNLKNLDSGIIRIGASTTVLEHVVMPFLETFHTLYSNIDIQITNNLTESLVSDLRNGNLDILFLNMPMKEEKDFKILNVMDVQDIFVCNKKYYDLIKGQIELKNLDKYPLIFQKSPSNTRNILDKYLDYNNVKLKPKTEVVSYNLIMSFIKAGFGIGYATKEFITKDLKDNSLYEIEVTPKIPMRYIGLVTLDKTIPNHSVNKLIKMMMKKN